MPLRKGPLRSGATRARAPPMSQYPLIPRAPVSLVTRSFREFRLSGPVVGSDFLHRLGPSQADHLYRARGPVSHGTGPVIVAANLYRHRHADGELRSQRSAERQGTSGRSAKQLHRDSAGADANPGGVTGGRRPPEADAEQGLRQGLQRRQRHAARMGGKRIDAESVDLSGPDGQSTDPRGVFGEGPRRSGAGGEYGHEFTRARLLALDRPAR
jgi:hypothetical protein